ncbi:hypothetical protein PCANC_27707 [Puccinia coronata f. sp. avenae]|uniref:Uncharacterized protein n=1 Tax=Puccinia coronata f. sp. avenae TaxID=200324 RepID=A0A2N5TPS9_9BASI|nr:hypothetical protein PCANC_27707 [Puccinia coronata f. sp. avenae]
MIPEGPEFLQGPVNAMIMSPDDDLISPNSEPPAKHFWVHGGNPVGIGGPALKLTIFLQLTESVDFKNKAETCLV